MDIIYSSQGVNWVMLPLLIYKIRNKSIFEIFKKNKITCTYTLLMKLYSRKYRSEDCTVLFIAFILLYYLSIVCLKISKI